MSLVAMYTYIGGDYSYDQLLNITAFSLLRRWLITTLSSGGVTAPSPSPAPTPTLDQYRGQVHVHYIGHVPIIPNPIPIYRWLHLRVVFELRPLSWVLTPSPLPFLPPSPRLSSRASASLEGVGQPLHRHSLPALVGGVDKGSRKLQSNIVSGSLTRANEVSYAVLMEWQPPLPTVLIIVPFQSHWSHLMKSLSLLWVSLLYVYISLQ